ncbi:MAG: primosomal protein N' [Eubacteriales bacterium]|nr:primosomal protein N' [Eubacteriales bacterium]
MLFADVIVDISVKSLDRPFQYIVPEEYQDVAVVGAQVLIPFGQGDRQRQGYIVGLSTEPNYDIQKTKQIICVEKQGVVAESHLLSLAYWIKEHYGGTMNDAIKAVMPVRREVQEKLVRRVYPVVERGELLAQKEEMERKHQVARVRVLDALLSVEVSHYRDGVDYDMLIRQCKVTKAVLRGLVERGLIQIAARQLYRNPYPNIESQKTDITLNEEQQSAVQRVLWDYQAGRRYVYLLHGVTGSGKTEVYMQCIQSVIRQGQQAIVLIPEIALTYQTVNRFYERFGDRVSVMHSRLSAGERFDQYTRAKNGEIDIMIGPRSALFTPFRQLGLIIVDEEHETSYQSEMPPKYHAREVAVQRAKMLGASVILGSATPSMEAYYRASTGEYQLLELKKRAGGAVLPSVEIVDLRQELEEKNHSIFSRSLADKIRQRLKRREQTILFLNRRGYAGFVSCRKCGEVIGCSHCSVALKPHLYRGQVDRLVCHYCGYQIRMPRACPKCGSRYIGTFGLGTEQVEEMVRNQFPEARVIRMDADTTSGKEGHDKLLKSFGDGEADILVGTQMIVKGHDFPGVTLVGILAADLSLNVGDYRAAERTYQLLAQAAGRAGRADKPGEVVLQTYQPEHYSIVCAAKQDYLSFYEEELLMRRMLQYPPVSNILGVLVLSEQKQRSEALAGYLAEQMRKAEDITVLGPTEASIGKLRDVYRMVIYVKAEEYDRLCQIKNELETYLDNSERWKDCRVLFDFNN